jgi:hypothetical protein
MDFPYSLLVYLVEFYSRLLIYLSIERAAFLPAPIARITVAAPVTVSPPANIPGIEV